MAFGIKKIACFAKFAKKFAKFSTKILLMVKLELTIHRKFDQNSSYVIALWVYTIWIPVAIEHQYKNWSNSLFFCRLGGGGIQRKRPHASRLLNRSSSPRTELMPIIKGFFPTLSTLGFHHADQRWFEKCESEDGAEDFGTRAAPLQVELVEVQRKKESSPSSLVPALLTAILYNASLELKCFCNTFDAVSGAHRLAIRITLCLSCSLLIRDYCWGANWLSHLSTLRLSLLVFMYFLTVPYISFNSIEFIFVIIPV